MRNAVLYCQECIISVLGVEQKYQVRVNRWRRRRKRKRRKWENVRKKFTLRRFVSNRYLTKYNSYQWRDPGTSSRIDQNFNQKDQESVHIWSMYVLFQFYSRLRVVTRRLRMFSTLCGTRFQWTLRLGRKQNRMLHACVGKDVQIICTLRCIHTRCDISWLFGKEFSRLFEHVTSLTPRMYNTPGTMGQKGYVRRETSPQSMYRSTCNSTRNHWIRWNASYKLYLSRCISCFVRHSLVPIRGSSLCLRSIDIDEHSNRVSVVTSSHETILVSLYSVCGILTRSRSYNIYTSCIFISAGTCHRQQDMERIRGHGTHAARSDVGCTNTCICIRNFSDARCGFHHEACSDVTK